MTAAQLQELCTQVSAITNAGQALLNLAKELGEENRFEALKIVVPVKIISDTTLLLSEFAGEVKPDLV